MSLCRKVTFKLSSGSRQYPSQSTIWVGTWSRFPQGANLWVVYCQFSTILHPLQV